MQEKITSKIWEHSDFAPLIDADRKSPQHCLYCQTPLRLLDKRQESEESEASPLNYWSHDVRSSLDVCDLCGWWIIHHSWNDYDPMYNEGAIAGVEGVLRNLDLKDLSVPSAELSRYLIAKYDQRFNLDPRKFEDLAAGVFREFGFDVVVTAFSGDAGIDAVVLSGKGNELLGVQVKRYNSRVETEQIRAFAGALVLRGLTKGVFVTTSDFQRGAHSTVENYSRRGLAIDLWDGSRFLDALRVSQRPLYEVGDDPATPFGSFWSGSAELPTVHSWCNGPENG